MTLEPRKICAFAVGVLTTLAVSSAFWPKPAPSVPARVVVVPEEPWNRQKFDSALAKMDQAKTKAEMVDAAAELGKIPVKEIPAALESIPLEKDGNLTLAVSTLLIRWASEDGEAAITWTWDHLKTSGLWRDTFPQLLGAWAWTNPDGLARWALECMATRKPDDPTLAEAEASDRPLITFSDVSGISRMLIREDPKLAYEVFLKRGGWSSNDDEMYKSLDDPAQLEQALQAFPNLEGLKARHDSMTFTMDSLAHAESLMTHWMKIDPEGFERSGYRQYLHPRFTKAGKVEDEWKQAGAPDREVAANRIIEEAKGDLRRHAVSGITNEWVSVDPDACRTWLESLPPDLTEQAKGGYVAVRAAQDLEGTLDFIVGTDPAYRHTYMMNAFDSWTKAHPGESPDMAAWTEQERRVWSDLEALKSVVEK